MCLFPGRDRGPQGDTMRVVCSKHESSHAGVRIYWAEGMIVMMIAMNVILSFVDHCGVFRIVNASYEGLKGELLVICGLSGVLSEGMICREYELSQFSSSGLSTESCKSGLSRLGLSNVDSSNMDSDLGALYLSQKSSSSLYFLKNFLFC